MSTLGSLWTGAVAYVSLGVGAGLSMAGNLADTYRTRGAGQVDALDKILALAWPALVILAIEMFVSERWKRSAMFQIWRWTGCLAIGSMAMVASWTHLHDLLASRGQLAIVAILGPLAIDGMVIMATGLILSSRGQLATAGQSGQLATAPASAPTVGQALANKDMATLANWPTEVATLDAIVQAEALIRGQDLAKQGIDTPANRPTGHTEHTPAGWTGPVASAADVAASELAMRGQEPTVEAGQLADDLDAWERGVDAAIHDAGQELARQAEAVANGHLAEDPPVVPAVPPAAALLIQECLAKQDAKSAIDALVAAEHGVSPRQARRWRAEVARTLPPLL